jgi:hypothetical protein
MLTMKCVLVCAWLASLPLAAAAQPVQRCETARSIDFKNLVYPLEEPRFTNGQTFPLRVVDGRYEEPHRPGYQGFFYLNVGDVVFGDVTGDGVEEAAVVAQYGSNSGNFRVTDAYVFQCQQGTPVLLAMLTQQWIQRDSGRQIFSAVDHSLRIDNGVVELTYDVRGTGSVSFRYKRVGDHWQRAASP